MKKFFVISVAVLFCLGMTLPAMASVKVGGMITQDVYYFHMDAADAYSGAAGGTGYGHFDSVGLPSYPNPYINPQGSFSAFDINLPQALNRLWVSYANDNNTIRGYIQVRGGNGLQSHYLNDIQNPGSTVVWNYAWIDWVVSPKDFFRFGRQTQAFSIRAPDQFMGEARGHIVGMNYGNLNGGASRDGVRWYHTFTDQVHFELGIYDPASNGADALGSSPNTPTIVNGNAATITEQSVLPRVDVTAPLFFGPLTIWPSFTYLKQKYDNLAPGDVDSFTIWGGSVGAQYVIGPVVLNGEATIGKNLGAGNYAGDAVAKPAVYGSTGTTQINDASVFSWWFQAGYKVGPATIEGLVGSNHVKRNDDASFATNIDLTSWMYGICVPIMVAKGFKIAPQIMFYDNDTNAKVGNGETVNFGREYLAGVQFQLVF